MAENSHASHDASMPSSSGHEDHNHEGPVVHTEVVPPSSLEDNILKVLLCLCFIVLSVSIYNWSTKMQEPPELSPGGHKPHAEQPAVPNGVTTPGAPAKPQEVEGSSEDYHRFPGKPEAQQLPEAWQKAAPEQPEPGASPAQ